METSQQRTRRRLRYERQSTGKRVAPTERDLLWFQKLRQHGPLPSNYLLQFSRHLCRSGTRALERLGDLYHESNTPHGGSYLDRPRKQWSAVSKFERTVYDLSSAACQVLREQGLTDAEPTEPRSLFHHRLMVACITASIELAIEEHSGLRYITQEEILARSPNKSIVIPCEISYTNPRTGKRQKLDRPLVPDALFGVEYTVGGQRHYRFFMLEADRNQEPVRRANLTETSYLRKVLQYKEVIGRGMYRHHFGMKSTMLVLNVTTNFRHMENIISLVREVDDTAPFMLFQTAPSFGDDLHVPDPCMDFVVGPWQRARLPGLSIAEPGS
jgi:hypothetical protein